MKHSKPLSALFLLASCAFALYVSFAYNVTAKAEDASSTPEAMPVSVIIATPEHTQIWKNFSGSVVAVDRAEIRPQVNGRLTEIRFTDGQYVNKDDILFVIDPSPYKAALAQAEATLHSAVNQADLAEKEYQRAKKLIEQKAISQSLMDERKNNRETANANVQGAQASVDSAKINLDYAYIKAPISGKTSRAEITIGNLVQAGPNAPLLTSIVADERVYADFEVDEDSYIKFIKSKANQNESAKKVPVRLHLTRADIEYTGFIQSFDNRIDPTSGTIRARAVFDNKDGLLLPGMSISVMMGSADNNDKILLSERIIGTDQDRKFVYIVNDTNTTEYREIKIGDSIDGKRVILSGLTGGEKVISEGLARIRPNMPVTPQIKTQEDIPPEALEQKE